jgi:hypothetical protein
MNKKNNIIDFNNYKKQHKYTIILDSFSDNERKDGTCDLNFKIKDFPMDLCGLFYDLLNNHLSCIFGETDKIQKDGIKYLIEYLEEIDRARKIE